MKATKHSTGARLPLLASLLLWSSPLPVGCVEAAPAPFTIYFSESKVALSGPIDSMEAVDRLSKAILEVLPGIQVEHHGLVIDGHSSLPEEKLFHSLVVELALSTHEGELEISRDQLLVGGLTDSELVASALRLRAAPLIGKRLYRERLCLVPSEDLPEIPLVLSDGQSRPAFSFESNLAPARREIFVAPGVLLEKLLGLIEATSNFAGLRGGQSAPPTPESALTGTEASPSGALAMSETELAVPTLPVEEPATPVVDPHEELGPVFFGRNSFLLQSGQQQNLSNILEQLGSEPWIGKPIILQITTYKAGSPGFSSWLGERRGAELIKQLTAGGVPREAITTKLMEAPEKAPDEGKVSVLLPRGAAARVNLP